MIVRNGDQSYVGCDDCHERLTPKMPLVSAKAFTPPETESRCMKCAFIKRMTE